MADYISRESLIERLGRNLAACNPGTFSESCYADAIETVRYAPAANVEPVKHGRWEWDLLDIYRCSVCGEKSKVKEVMNEPVWDYCPNCGAKMDGGAEDV